MSVMAGIEEHFVPGEHSANIPPGVVIFYVKYSILDLSILS
jgi:hypothetical protein